MVENDLTGTQSSPSKHKKECNWITLAKEINFNKCMKIKGNSQEFGDISWNNFRNTE